MSLTHADLIDACDELSRLTPEERYGNECRDAFQQHYWVNPEFRRWVFQHQTPPPTEGQIEIWEATFLRWAGSNLSHEQYNTMDEWVALIGEEPCYDRYSPDPAPQPVKAKTFDEWLAETSALLEECAERKQ